MNKITLLEERRRNWVCSKEVDNALRDVSNRSDNMDAVTNILHKVTSKISIAIKEEMKEEINKTSVSLMNHKIDEYLSQELNAYGCKICLEIMNCQANRTPLILNCGHTLCKICFELMNKKQCPLCRAVINSHCVNLSLKELIDSFLAMAKKKENISNSTYDASITEDNRAGDYSSKLSNINNRITIIGNVITFIIVLTFYIFIYFSTLYKLESELNSIFKENYALYIKIEKVSKTKSQLMNERIKVENNIKLLSEELDLIDEHLKRNNAKNEDLITSEESNKQKIKMLNGILNELKNDLSKYTILSDSNPNL